MTRVPILLDGHRGGARDHVGQLAVHRARVADESVVVREGAEDFPVGAVDRRRPAGAKPVLQREVFEVRPQGIVGDVEDGDGPVMKRRGTAGADLRPDLDSVDGSVVRVGKRGPGPCSRRRPSSSRMRMEAIIPDGVISSTMRTSSSSVARSGAPEEIISAIRSCALSRTSLSSCGSVVMGRCTLQKTYLSLKKGSISVPATAWPL